MLKDKLLPLFGGLLDKLPILDLLPIFVRAWNKLDDEKKEEIATSLILAGGKFAAQYAQSGGSR